MESKNNWNWNKIFIYSIKTIGTAYKIPNTMNIPWVYVLSRTIKTMKFPTF